MSGPRHQSQAGFTLVELLVAMAVLAVIVVVAASILGAATFLTTSNNTHMDANDQARAVFDRMSDDFSRMVRRKDVDYIFWKAGTTSNPPYSTPANDVMYFYTEGASYFDNSIFSLVTGYSPNTTPEKNSISLVGYRINNIPASAYPSGTNPSYSQMERLGKALSWDGQAYNASQPAQNSLQPNVAVFLTYPPAGNDVVNGPSYTDPTSMSYSTAYFCSTIAGAYSNNSSDNFGALPSAVGTFSGGSPATTSSGNPLYFNDSTDTSYRSIGSQVFRFEYSFQLKDGTMSDKPMMVYSAGSPNGVPSSNINGGVNAPRPLPTDDSANDAGDGTFAIGSRWWDPTNQIGYICLDATPNYAVWHEIGIQDVAAVIVTIAVIGKKGLIYSNANGGDLQAVAAMLPDYVASTTTSTVTGDPAYLLDPSNNQSWAYALLPGHAVSTMSGVNKLPQPMISQIRLYQRYFYLNTF